MKRLLIVAPRFAPSNAADGHRVRQSLPYYRENGWEPTVLAVRPEEVAAPVDPFLLRTLPRDAEVVRVGAVPRAWTRRVGLGSLEARALVPLARAGGRLLRERPFDAVFFSTTAMGVTALGPRWRRAHGVPFVVDLQDPWVNDYYARTGAPPPGGRLKYGLARALAQRAEPAVLRRAAHVVAVSAAYPEALAARYPWFSADRATVLPFGAPERDVEALRAAPVANPVFDRSDGLVHWAYVGRAGPDMAFALSAIFGALAEARRADPGRFERLRLHFVGTSYAEGGRARETVAPVAARFGLGDVVEERPHRVPYAEALQILLDADALVVPGSDDPGYTASKLYPYVLARKPLLAVFHERSSVVGVLRDTEAGVVVPFASGEPAAAVAARVGAAWLADDRWRTPPATDWGAFGAYTARAMTRRQCEVFDGVVAQVPPET